MAETKSIKEQGVEITTKVLVKNEDIESLLCTALEGGSNYWYTITEFHEPPALVYRSDETEIFRHLDYPMNEGGYLMIGDKEDEEREPVKLDLAALHRGLQLMAEKYPDHFKDVVDENADAITGDVMLQLALFGEVVYG
jgi:hypothetical protein